MKTTTRKYVESTQENQEGRIIFENIYYLEQADRNIEYSEEMVKHWQRLLKKYTDEKNDLLHKAGFM